MEKIKYSKEFLVNRRVISTDDIPERVYRFTDNGRYDELLMVPDEFKDNSDCGINVYINDINDHLDKGLYRLIEESPRDIVIRLHNTFIKKESDSFWFKELDEKRRYSDSLLSYVEGKYLNVNEYLFPNDYIIERYDDWRGDLHCVDRYHNILRVLVMDLIKNVMNGSWVLSETPITVVGGDERIEGDNKPPIKYTYDYLKDKLFYRSFQTGKEYVEFFALEENEDKYNSFIVKINNTESIEYTMNEVNKYISDGDWVIVDLTSGDKNDSIKTLS